MRDPHTSQGSYFVWVGVEMEAIEDEEGRTAVVDTVQHHAHHTGLEKFKWQGDGQPGTGH